MASLALVVGLVYMTRQPLRTVLALSIRSILETRGQRPRVDSIPINCPVGLERLPTAAIASFYQRWPRPIALLEGLATQVANWSRCRHRRLLYFS